MDLLRGAANTVGSGFRSITDAVGGGLSDLADTAADTAADAALAPLRLIEKSVSKVAGLGPEIVARRRDKINRMLTTIESKAKRYNDAAEGKKMRDARSIIIARTKQVNDDSTVPRDIKDSFNIILNDTEASPEELINALANAEDGLLVHENKEFSGWRLIKRAWRISSEYIYYILLFVCAIFGGIILSNVYINETFLPIRAYYFFYGTVFFPISLLYGAINTPEWNSTLFPLFMIAGPEPFVQPMVGGNDLDKFQRDKEIFEIGAAIRQGEAAGKTRVQAAQDLVAALAARGESVDVAQNKVLEELIRGGLSREVAMQALLSRDTPKNLTFTQRLAAVGTELFGYKITGGSSIPLRIVSIVLSLTTLGWAYFRGDLNDIYDRVYETYTGTSMLQPSGSRALGGTAATLPTSSERIASFKVNTKILVNGNDTNSTKEKFLSFYGFSSDQIRKLMAGQDLSNAEIERGLKFLDDATAERARTGNIRYI